MFKTNQATIEAYLDSLLTQRKLSGHTVANYRRDLLQLLKMSEETSLVNLTHLQIRRFVSQLHAQGMNPRSIARKLSAWRGFYQWLAEKTGLPFNPAETIKAPRRVKTLPKALSVDDAIQLVATKSVPPLKSSGDDVTPICNQAMFELLYSSGLRVSELTGLDIRHVQENNYTSLSWINLDEQEVIVTGKGKKRRVVPVGKEAVQALRSWIAVRDELMLPETQDDERHALFINQRGRRMTSRVVQLRLKAHAQMLGLPLNVHPHILRHSFASHVLQSSGDLRAVQEMLGHNSISSTQVYTALDFQHLSQIYDTTHPRAKKK